MNNEWMIEDMNGDEYMNEWMNAWFFCLSSNYKCFKVLPRNNIMWE